MASSTESTTSRYTKTLSPTVFDGIVDGVHLKWKEGADQSLAKSEVKEKVPKQTLKAISEHYAVIVTKSMKNSKAKIFGAPHDFSTNSATEEHVIDGMHVRITTSGPTREGRHDVHIYLSGAGREGDESRFEYTRKSISFSPQPIGLL